MAYLEIIGHGSKFTPAVLQCATIEKTGFLFRGFSIGLLIRRAGPFLGFMVRYIHLSSNVAWGCAGMRGRPRGGTGVSSTFKLMFYTLLLYFGDVPLTHCYSPSLNRL